MIAGLLVLAGVVLLALCVGLYKRNVHQWIVPHTLRNWRMSTQGTRKVQGMVHLMFMFVDHYEPLAERASEETAVKRVQRWVDEYPKLAGRFRDADGCHPKHSFFYPEEEYRPDLLDMIGKLCRQGYGEVEVHLHHDNDTSEGLRNKLDDFVETLHARHGMLPAFEGRPRFGFIHGNWALDNSRADGRWCGVNDELAVLAAAGCYADYTLPSAPNDTQTHTVNSIYYAIDDHARPKSHDHGVPVRAGTPGHGDLMIVQGPLSLNWRRRRFGLWPKLENADIEPHDVPIAARLAQWVHQWVHVEGRPDWVFVKVHTHGATEVNADWIFGGETESLFQALNDHYNDGTDFALHYVTAREAYNIVKAAEAGKSGDPGVWRDFVLPRPSAS